VDEERLRRLQAAWWTLRRGWDDGRAGELVAAVPDLVAEVRALRRQVREARTWAWSEHHQSFSDRWLGGRAPDGKWPEPEWLRSPYEPFRQTWWDELADSSDDVSRRGAADPATVVADALRELGLLGFAADRFDRRDAALAAVEQLRRQRDDAEGEAQHWLDMYTACVTARTGVSGRPEDASPQSDVDGDE
jgi:hypothetical protein